MEIRKNMAPNARTTRRTSVRLIIAATCVALIAGCGGDDDGDAATETDGSNAAASSITNSGATTPDTDQTPPAAATAPVDGASVPASSPPVEPTGDPVKIGYIAPVGTTILNFDFGVAAARAAVIGINDRGGINGRPAELVFCNEKNDPNEAARCAQQMIDEGVIATAATLSLTGGLAIDAALGEAGIPQIGNFATQAAEFNSPNIYLLDASTLGSLLGIVAQANADGYEKVALVRLEGAFNQLVADTFKTAVPALGPEYVGDVVVPASATDLASVTQQLSNLGADFVVCVVATKEAPLLQAANQLGAEYNFGFTDGAFTQDQIASLGELVEDVILAAPVPPLTATEEFPAIAQMLDDLAAAREAGVEAADEDLIRSNSLRIWFAVQAVAAVANQSGAVDAGSLRDALESGKSFDLPIDPAWTPTTPGPEGFSEVSRPYAYASVMTDGEPVLAQPEPFNVFPDS